MKTLLLAAAMPVMPMDGQAPGLERWISLEPACRPRWNAVSHCPWQR